MDTREYRSHPALSRLTRRIFCVGMSDDYLARLSLIARYSLFDSRGVQ